MSDDMDLVLAFDTDSGEFARGFEAGRLWALMDAEHHLDETVHAANAEMVMRMAEAKGFAFQAQDIDDEWTRVELYR